MKVPGVAAEEGLKITAGQKQVEVSEIKFKDTDVSKKEGRR